MYTLYIDTHFVKLVIALFKDDILLGEKILESNLHSENTISLLDDLLKEFSIKAKDLNEVIVVTGPGSFTGVRIGVVIAKTLGFCLNIPIKSISYLEAMALNYDDDVIVGIKDRNGVFIGEFTEDKTLLNDYYYLTNKEFETFNKNIILDDNVDLIEVIKYLKHKESVHPHLLKPLYVKRIEVMKWLEKLLLWIYPKYMS